MQCSPEQREESDDSRAPFYLMIVVKGHIQHSTDVQHYGVKRVWALGVLSQQRHYPNTLH